jgi:hypothetical protein
VPSRIEESNQGPEFARKGILISRNDPQPEVRRNAETASDWVYRDEAVYLYGKAVLFIDRSVDPLHHLDRSRLPEPVLASENLRNKNTLAAFRLTRSPEGLQNVIIMNTERYADQDGKGLGIWPMAQLETLLHEQVHEWQQVLGKDPVNIRRIYHNREFVEKCELLGLHPYLGEGYHLKLADGPFAIRMNELGINPPDLKEKPDDTDIGWFKWQLDFQGKAKNGTSTLSKWECPECGLKARIGIKGDPQLVHEPCSERLGRKVFLIKVDDQAHQMTPKAEYKMPE